MNKIGVWVKLLSFVHAFFGNVRVGMARCVAIIAVASATLFSVGTNAANAAAQAYGITFNVTTTGSGQSVTMVFNFTGSLMVDSDGYCLRNEEDITGGYESYTVGATTALRTVKCTFENSGNNHWIKLQSGTITAYPTYTSTNAPATTYSVFRFSAGQTYIRSIASGSLGEVFYTLGNGTTDGQQPRFISTFSGCTNFKLNSTNDGSSDVGLFAGGSSGNHGGASGCSGGGICGTAASWMFANMFNGCTSLDKIPFKQNNGMGFFRNLTVATTSYGVFYQTFRGCTALTNIGTVTVGNTTYNINMFFNMGTTVSQKMFQGMFYGCTNASFTTVPSGFFSHFSTANSSATYLFYQTFYGCTKLTTITGAFTGVNNGTPTQYMFYGTFQNCTALTSLPDSLFSPFTGTPAAYMFYYTFSGCSGLTSLNANIFSNMGQTPASYMFAYMFQNCTNIVTVPSGFFSRFNTYNSGATYLFSYTFSGCNKITTVTGAFTSVNGNKATNYMFNYTFQNCTSLTSLPANLFGNFTTVAQYMFRSTFRGCTGLTSLSNNIFGTSAISSNMADYMFQHMFYGCTGLQSVMSGFFSRFTGKPSNYMFNGTFQGCTSLTTITDIFTGVGSAVTGSNRVFGQYMFYATFSGCTALAPGGDSIFSPFDGWTTAQGVFAQTFYNCKARARVNGDLFSKVVGAPEADLFYQTFYGCTGLFGAIPKDFFAGLRGSDHTSTGAFQQTFYGCTALGTDERIGAGALYFIPPELLYAITPVQTIANGETTLGSNQITNMFSNTGLMTSCPEGYSEYTGNPYNVWNKTTIGGKVVCEPTMPTTKFSMTLTALTAGTEFKFSIIAGGDFYVDWGDGAPKEKQTSSSGSGIMTFSHKYLSARSDGATTINLSSANVTGYVQAVVSGSYKTALNFQNLNSSHTKIKTLSGNLGGSVSTALFPTVGNGESLGNQPRFHRTFYGATNLQTIPATLFSGFTGITATSGESMFYETFRGCTSLTSIPSGLFSSINAVAGSMFRGTFYGCTGLNTALPSGLFGGLGGDFNSSNYVFYQTFYGCSGLLGPIPENLFGNLSGTIPAYAFYQMFYNCSSLTGYIPPRLFMKMTKWTTNANNMYQIFGGSTGLATTSTTCSGFLDAPDQFYTGYEGTVDNSFGGKISCFNGLTINTSSVSSFSFELSAKGDFYVGWGDNSFNQYSRDSATSTPTSYSKSYAAASTKRIQIGGAATGYYNSTSVPAIRFLNNTAISSITGSLGYVFSNSVGTPRFYQTFRGCTGLTALPSTLFKGLTTASTYMFQQTFYGCTSLATLPGDLFSTITSNPSNYMFYQTFYGCTGLKSIPSNLFNYLGTTPAQNMFYGTFQGCTGLGSDTSIANPVPANLFSRFNGKNPPAGMFRQTFYGCSNWTGTLPDLFSGLSGTTVNQYVFYRTFYNCSKLYGALPDTFVGTSGSVATQTFYQTFYGCTNLGKNAVNGTSTYWVPPAFFGNVTPNNSATTPVYQMFTGTGLLTECPGVYNQYFTGFEAAGTQKFDGDKLSCKRCAYLTGQEAYGNTCYDLCEADGDNMTKLTTKLSSTKNLVFNLFKNQITGYNHHVNLRYNGTVCYIPLKEGTESGGNVLNFQKDASNQYSTKGTTVEVQ